MFLSTKKIPTKYLIIAAALIVVLFIGFAWAASGFSYKLQHTRVIAPPDANLKLEFDMRLAGFDPRSSTLETIFEKSNNIVADMLSYNFKTSQTNPNLVYKIKSVNCSGYAALQVCLLNYIFKKYDMLGIRAEWHSGRVYYCGQQMPAPLEQHCYPVVINKSGKRYYPDACFKDLFGLNSMVEREEI